MRVFARTVFIVFCCVFAFTFFHAQAYAQTNTITTNTTDSSNTQSPSNFLTSNTYPNVPINHHSFAQIELMDILSAAMCQLTGIDPSDPSQPCLGVDPSNGKFALAVQPQQFGSDVASQQAGGALGFMATAISTLYVPAVTTSQYTGYLASNFGIVKNAYAQTPPNCNTNPFGYGFCGLSPLLSLWSNVRDLAYALLTILFIAIGIGVMLRFKVDPRTVMTLQNQIPRVIIAILLITFSYAIAGAMIDLMWTATYAGVNFISSAAPNSKIDVDCNNPNSQPTPLSQNVETRLVDDPVSFTNTVFRANCKGGFDNGFVDLADKVAASLGDLITQVLHDMFFSNNTCHVSFWQVLLVVPGVVKGAECALQSGALNLILWGLEFVVKIIIIVTMLIALFRLWYQLIKCYLTFLIFVMVGPIWIVLGLVPGRPLGFEKWLRIIFANLAVFPLVAFLLVFARVLVDSVPTNAGGGLPNSFFVPPLVGNPSLSTFSTLMGFGAILIAPTIPDQIKDRMKATGQAKFGAAVGAAIGMGATAFSSPGRRIYENLNRSNPTTGAPEGALAIQKAKLARNLPIIGKRVVARDRQREEARHAYSSGELGNVHSKRQHKTDINNSITLNQRMGFDQRGNPLPEGERPAEAGPGRVRQSVRRTWNRVRPGRNRGEPPETS